MPVNASTVNSVTCTLCSPHPDIYDFSNKLNTADEAYLTIWAADSDSEWNLKFLAGTGKNKMRG